MHDTSISSVFSSRPLDEQRDRDVHEARLMQCQMRPLMQCDIAFRDKSLAVVMFSALFQGYFLKVFIRMLEPSGVSVKDEI